MQYLEKVTKEKYREDIRKRCEETFKDHILVRQSEDRWLCHRPGTMFHSFWVLFAPCHVVVVGDVGDLVLRMSDDALRWLLGTNDLDYMLSKSQHRGEDQKVFLVQEALDYIEEEIGRIQPDEEGNLDESDREQKQKYEELKEEFLSGLYQGSEEPNRLWARLWWEILDDCEAPRCTDWDTTLLHCYHALMTFRRLYPAEPAE